MTTILVVEDEPHTQLVIRKILNRLGGFTVILSEDPAEGLPLVRNGKVDLVVMDISLENTFYQGRSLDGVHYTRLIKQINGGQMPVLLSTAHAMPGDAERLLAASGADGYIAKPFADAWDLVYAVRDLLGLG